MHGPFRWTEERQPDYVTTVTERRWRMVSRSQIDAPPLVSRWKSTAADHKFRQLYDEATASMCQELEHLGLVAADVTDIPTEFGTTRCLHWSGVGEPLILLHGQNGSWLAWGPLLAELKG